MKLVNNLNTATGNSCRQQSLKWFWKNEGSLEARTGSGEIFQIGLEIWVEFETEIGER